MTPSSCATDLRRTPPTRWPPDPRLGSTSAQHVVDTRLFRPKALNWPAASSLPEQVNHGKPASAAIASDRLPNPASSLHHRRTKLRKNVGQRRRISSLGSILKSVHGLWHRANQWLLASLDCAGCEAPLSCRFPDCPNFQAPWAVCITERCAFGSLRKKN